jgi:UDPglucose--hexose-1-phosphate uridylyltransferase
MPVIEYREERLDGAYFPPGSDELAPHHALRRDDPITGWTVRITGKRPRDRATEPRGVPDLSEISARTQESCPFCGDGPTRLTPRFPAAVVPEGRIRRREATLFPNLAPYGRWSGVTTFNADHHVPLGGFSHEDWSAALENCLDLAMRVGDAEPAFQWVAVTQNILPPSGGALFHPHLQVNIDERPMGYHRQLLDAIHTHPLGHELLDHLAEDARKAGRHIGDSGAWTWFTPFAPLAPWEVQGIWPATGTVHDLTGDVLCDLVRGVLAVQSWYGARGRNAANLSIFLSLRTPYAVLVRLNVRSTYHPWYRSDQSVYEVGLHEPVTDMPPEILAARMRADFDPGSGSL